MYAVYVFSQLHTIVCTLVEWSWLAMLVQPTGGFEFFPPVLEKLRHALNRPRGLCSVDFHN